MTRCAVCLLILASVPAYAQVKVTELKSGVNASFRGLSTVSDKVAWVTGSNATVIRTKDGGETWEPIKVPFEPTKDKNGKPVLLDFRDVEVLPDGSLVLMSIGSGATSRLYRSTDDGATWKVVLQNTDEKGFFDGITFSHDGKRGVLYGDPIGGRMDLYLTNDAGQSWQRVPEENRPRLVEGEYGFAASGSGAAIIGDNIWIGTGGAVCQMHHSKDGGRSWSATKVPVRSGNPSSGIFSIAFVDRKSAVAIGGDYLKPNEAARNVSFTTDGGATWQLFDGTKMPHKACIQSVGDGRFIACGRTGIAFSADAGRKWMQLSDASYYVLDYDLRSKQGFMAGRDGRVAKFTILSR